MPLGGTVEPVRPVRRGTRRQKRRIVAAIALILLIPLVALGMHGYRVIDAIGQAQRAAVVPLPTRASRTTDSAAARVLPTSTPAAGAVAPNQTPVTEEPSTAAQAAGPDGDASSATAVPTPPSPNGNAAPPRVVADTDADDEQPSAFDVMRELAEAGTDRGDPGQAGVWQGQTSLTIMVLGVDMRQDGGDQNADVIMLVRLNLDTKAIEAVSIPRDLLVTIPGHGDGKINGAYNIGVQEHPEHPAAGVAMMRDTIEDNFGVIIDDYVLLDFDGFEEAIDAVGGVDVRVPARIVDEAYPTDDYGTEVVVFEPGVQHMDGETALKYARTRNTDSDDGRRQRQFDILLALFDEARDVGSITQANKIILALGDTVQTSFALEQQLTLARIGFDMDRSAISMESIPASMLEEGYADSGAWVYFSDLPTVAAFIQTQLGVSPGSGA